MNEKKRRNKMKSKKFNKKLALNKETITNLTDKELKDVHGHGACGPASFLVCPTEDTGCTLFCPTTQPPTNEPACTLLCPYSDI